MLRIRLAGAWRLQNRLPPLDAVEVALAETPGQRQVVLEAGSVTAWDTGLVSFVMRLLQ